MDIKIVLSGRVFEEATHSESKQHRGLTMAFERRGKIYLEDT